MQPTTIRLPETTLEELDGDAKEFGFRNRAELVRHLIENRETVLGATTDDYEQTTGDIESRLNDLEARLETLEQSTSPDAATDDYGPTTGDGAGPTTIDYEPTTDLAECLNGWPPRGTKNREEVRRAGVKALEWLQSRGEPANKREFLDALDGLALESQSPDTFWRNVIRPALSEAEPVEYAHGRHEYRWTGE